jgi:Ulp1 protease family, C-terminal catalytic domain
MDSNILQELASIHTPQVIAPAGATRILFGKQDHANTKFAEKDIDIFDSPSARLNDICLNGGAAILQDAFSSTFPNSSNRCALLSTFDLVRIRYKASDDDIWRNIRRSSYWLKTVWILPIHRPEHWVLCIILVESRELLLFDSFAAHHPWRREVGDIMRLVGRIVLLANRHGHPLQVSTEGWTARPISVSFLFFSLLEHHRHVYLDKRHSN